jgi:hypothetical protein
MTMQRWENKLCIPPNAEANLRFTDGREVPVKNGRGVGFGGIRVKG